MQGLPSISSVDLGPWQSFYTALAATSATLAGLLFVALSFNLELLGRAEHEHTHRTASHAFATFLYVLLIALVLLMPHATRAELVVTLAVVGLVGLGGAIALWWQTRRGASRSLHRRAALRWLAWSGSVFLALLIAAVGVARHWPWVLHWLGLVLIVLLFAAVQRCWYLLVTVRLLEAPSTVAPTASARDVVE
jgi:modulator of FtsH protease